jgi:hypothetical protein
MWSHGSAVRAAMRAGGGDPVVARGHQSLLGPGPRQELPGRRGGTEQHRWRSCWGGQSIHVLPLADRAGLDPRGRPAMATACSEYSGGFLPCCRVAGRPAAIGGIPGPVAAGGFDPAGGVPGLMASRSASTTAGPRRRVAGGRRCGRGGPGSRGGSGGPAGGGGGWAGRVGGRGTARSPRWAGGRPCRRAGGWVGSWRMSPPRGSGMATGSRPNRNKT